MVTKSPTKRSTTLVEKAEALDHVFHNVKALLAMYVPPFEARTDEWGGYHLWKTKPIVANGRKRNEVYFAGVVQRKGYVAFHYMPVYAQPDLKAIFKPELLALLKGRACFNLKTPDPKVTNQVKKALADGFKMYKRNGWV